MKRIELPKVYYLFYSILFKSVLGDAKHKSYLEIEDESNDHTFSTAIIEAFALLVLKNNYFAWICDFRAKSPNSHKQLKTEYDTVLDNDKNRSLSEVFPVAFEGFEYKMTFPNQEEEASNCEDDNSNDNNESNMQFEVYSKVNDTIQFNQVRNKRRKLHKTISADAMRLQQGTVMMMENNRKKLEEHNSKRVVARESKIETDKKKRRLLKELKVFTGVAKQDQRKFRGWADEATVALMDIRDQIIKDVKEGKYKVWALSTSI